jgi:hypothetical protein
MVVEMDLLLEEFDNLESLLAAYNELSGQLLAADFEFTDETDHILEEREELITQMKEVNILIAGLLDKQPPETADTMIKMLAGENVMSGFEGEEKAVRAKILSLRSLQSEIVQKENVSRIKFNRKYEEVREELENLQKEKKKLNFYQNAKLDVKGSTFDSQN